MSLPTFAPCQQYGAYVVLRTARWMWIGPFRSNYATEGYQNVLRVVRRLLVTFFLLVTCISTFWWLVCLIATLWSDVNGLSTRCSMFSRFSSFRFFQIAPQLRRKRSPSYILLLFFARRRRPLHKSLHSDKTWTPGTAHCTNRCSRIRREQSSHPNRVRTKVYYFRFSRLHFNFVTQKKTSFIFQA